MLALIIGVVAGFGLLVFSLLVIASWADDCMDKMLREEEDERSDKDTQSS